MKYQADESQAGIKIARGNINNLRYADDTILMAESEEEQKSLLIKVKEESGKSWLKTQHSVDKETRTPPRSFFFSSSRKDGGHSDRTCVPKATDHLSK